MRTPLRVVVDDDVDRLQVYNGDIKPSSTNCPKAFSGHIYKIISSSSERYVNPIVVAKALRGQCS